MDRKTEENSEGVEELLDGLISVCTYFNNLVKRIDRRKSDAGEGGGGRTLVE